MEVWKDVVGFEEYFQVSNLGNVYSKRTNKVLKQNILKNGYSSISTKIGGRNGKCYCFKIHRLVAKAFIPNDNENLIVNHIDGDKLNNNVDNLEWCTPSENVRHAIINGLLNHNHMIGKSSSSRNLTIEDAELIREIYRPEDKEFSFRALSRMFNCHHETVRNIVNRVSYNS